MSVRPKSDFLEVMVEATGPWALAALAILLVVISHERDHAARAEDDDE